MLAVLTSAILSFVNCNFLETESGGRFGVSVSIITVQDIQPNIWHFVGTGLVLASVALGLITIFLFKNRALQVKLCYALMLLQLALTLIVSFCPVVELAGMYKYENSGLASIIGIIGMMGAYMAARYVKKDIELLKSADRIR